MPMGADAGRIHAEARAPAMPRARGRRVLHPGPAAMLLVALAAFAFLGALALASQLERGRAVKAERRAEATLLLERAAAELARAEAAGRLFLLTGRDEDLAAYEAAHERARRGVAAVPYLGNAPASLAGRLSEAAGLIRAGLVEVDRAVALRRSGAVDEALALADSAADRRLTSRLAQAVGEALAAGRREAEARAAGLVARGLPLPWLALLACLLGAVVTVAAGLGLSRSEAKRRRAKRRLAESEARFRNLADHAPVITWMSNAAGACTYLAKPWHAFTGQEAAAGKGRGWLTCIHPDDRDIVEATVGAACAAQAPFRLDFRLRRHDGAHHWVIDAGAPRFGQDGAFLGHVGSLVDIDERKELEQRQEILVRELNHRVKNILAVTQAVARLTGAGAASLGEFLHAFNGRLQALAAANELLTGSAWRGTGLAALIGQVLRPHGAQDPSRFELAIVDGPIPAAMAQDLTLSLHELATNAAKYGALSAPSGRVAIEAEARTAPDGSTPTVRLVWRELGGPRVRAPAQPGFGTRLLRQLVTGQQGGTLDLDWRPEGLVCRLELAAPA